MLSRNVLQLQALGLGSGPQADYDARAFCDGCALYAKIRGRIGDRAKDTVADKVGDKVRGEVKDRCE